MYFAEGDFVSLTALTPNRIIWTVLWRTFTLCLESKLDDQSVREPSGVKEKARPGGVAFIHLWQWPECSHAIGYVKMISFIF